MMHLIIMIKACIEMLYMR